MHGARMVRRLSALMLLVLPACGGGGVESAGLSPAAREYPQYANELISADPGEVKIDDGDTFEVHGRTIRILGLDTPETAHPHHGFYEDQPYGREATEKARELIESAEVLEYLPFDNDQYGRLLAHVFLDGELFAVKMIEAGLAYESVSFYGDNGFPELAERILEAAERAGEPDFMPPHQWRELHRKVPLTR